MFAEGAAPAGDLSEEVDEVQSCSVRLPGEEEGYDADSESNPETMKQQEEGRSTHNCTLNRTAALSYCKRGQFAPAIKLFTSVSLL